MANGRLHSTLTEATRRLSRMIPVSSGVRPCIVYRANPKPYGNVTYADPKNGKYPIDTKAHAKAAWSYINMPKNAAKYPVETARGTADKYTDLGEPGKP